MEGSSKVELGIKGTTPPKSKEYTNSNYNAAVYRWEWQSRMAIYDSWPSWSRKSGKVWEGGKAKKSVKSRTAGNGRNAVKAVKAWKTR